MWQIVRQNCYPLVSVIVPCYNQVKYLPSAVNSVLAQTYTNWETIIVNDGSTDDSELAAAQFGDSRIRYVRQENRGLSGARNSGIQLARGSFLGFLDADDEWDPAFLRTCIDSLATSTDPRVVGVYTSCIYIDENGRRLPQPGNVVVPVDKLRARLIAGPFFPINAALVQASVVREVGMFDETLRATEDKDLWLHITRRYSLQGIAHPLAHYRVYPGSMSTNATTMYTNRMKLLTKHFGSETSDPARWPPEKRVAFSHAYRSAALEYIAQGDTDQGWGLLLKGARISSDMLAEVQTFYEMACVSQPRGYRGQVECLDINKTGGEILEQIDKWLMVVDGSLGSLHETARGSACLALAQLADQAGNWRLARHYMWLALLANPKLLAESRQIRRLVKLMLGKDVVFRLRRLRSTAYAK